MLGLISRLASPEGGFDDYLSYPEYCRSIFETASDEFRIAIGELQSRHGTPAQQRFILLSLWMVHVGAGLVPEKHIVDSAKRLRISQDIEFEMDRFTGVLEESMKKYTYVDRPKAGPPQQAEIAVDSLARLCMNARDGDELPEEDAKLIEDIIFGGLLGKTEEFRQLVRTAIQTRRDRATLYTL